MMIITGILTSVCMLVAPASHKPPCHRTGHHHVCVQPGGPIILHGHRYIVQPGGVLIPVKPVR